MEELHERYAIGALLRTEEAFADLKSIAIKHGAVDVAFRSPTRVRLAYSIKKTEGGFFGTATISLPTRAVSKINEAARLHTDVLRFEISKIRPMRAAVEEPVNGLSKEQASPGATGEEDLAPRRALRSYRHVELSNEALHKKLEEMLQ
ncbi:30S ribosomal protein S6 [Candidatus Wolfebacteria bacterium]|nr:30S ribosomal protein S6 [Candidatus Wolfebacteria bacterium]